jgi:hemerythrin
MDMNIRWQESFSIGIGEIDVQHRNIIKIINNALGENKQDDSPEEYLTQLHETHENHFLTEEAYMLGFGYHKYRQHKAEHDNFREKIKIGNNLKGKEAGDYLKTLSEELVTHITKADREMAEYFQQIRK